MRTATRGWMVLLTALSVLCFGVAESAAAPRRAPVSSQILQCVVYARGVSTVQLRGNAHTWWSQAAGQYSRDQRPVPGAVLVFKRSGSMRYGHVSVVRELRGSREIVVDHANWATGRAKGRVDRGVSVIDVSPRNDWTMVRVWYPPAGAHGRPYPTYGFILPRPAAPDEAIRSVITGAGADTELAYAAGGTEDESEGAPRAGATTAGTALALPRPPAAPAETVAAAWLGQTAPFASSDEAPVRRLR